MAGPKAEAGEENSFGHALLRRFREADLRAARTEQAELDLRRDFSGEISIAWRFFRRGGACAPEASCGAARAPAD